jgi:hypothetical protein
MTTDPRIAALAEALRTTTLPTDAELSNVPHPPEEWAAAILAALPGWMLVRSEAGTRLIRVGYDLEQFGARTADGRLQTAEWREPLDDGTYEPLFTATDDGMALLTTAELVRLRKIEEAARAFVAVWGETEAMESSHVFTALRAALGEDR